MRCFPVSKEGSSVSPVPLDAGKLSSASQFPNSRTVTLSSTLVVVRGVIKRLKY